MEKPIGIWRSWALVAGMMIGSGIFTLPAILASYGSYSFIGWGVTGFGAICLALCYSFLSSRKPGLGGPYAYVQEAFGLKWAALVAWGYWLSLVSSVTAVALSFVGYIQVYFPILGQHFLFTSISATLIIIFFAAINVRGVRGASIVQLVTTVIKIVPLLLIGILGVALGDVSDIPAINPDNTSFVGMVASLCLLVMWAFIGVESATLPSEDTLNPKKTIPRASILGTLTAILVYVIAMYGLMSIVPLSELQNSSSPFADAAQIIFGNSGAILVTIGALFAIGGTLNVLILITGTMMLAGARDGMFPKYFSSQSQHGTPQRALIFSSLLAIILLLLNANKTLMNSFEYLLIVATFCALTVYLGTALASLKIQWRDYQKENEFSRFNLVVAILATLFSFLAIVGAWVLYQ